MELQVQQKELERQNEELKKTLEDLQASREHFSKFYDAGPVGYVSINGDGVIHHANRAIADLLDLSVASLINNRLIDFIYPDDRDEFYLFINDHELQFSNAVLSIRLNRSKAFQNASQCPGFRIINCAKSSCIQNDWMIHVECRRVANYPRGDENHICLTLTDCSETKLEQESSRCLNGKLEDRLIKKTDELIGTNLILQQKIEELSLSRHQLVEKEAMLNAIFNAAVEGILTIDKSGIIRSANSAVQTIFGYSPDELIGRGINMLIPDSKRKKHDTYLQIKDSSLIDRIRNVDGLRKDGTLVPLDISITEFSLENIDYYASVVRDVSSRKRKEQEDKEHLNELAHVTRLGLMGEMASGIAHEVNQPLTAIAGYTQACLNFIDGDRPDLLQIREVIQKAYHQALRAGQIIHRMREFVTFKTIHRTSVDINTLINFCVEMAEGDLKSNHVTVKCNMEQNIPLIHVDQVQVEQVLLNLIRNSLEAVILLPEHSKRFISIQTSLDDGHRILVRVKDNGPGIEKSEQEKILTPFFTSKKTGMGMGLSISQSIIKAHDGELYFNSAYGKGSSFYFTLPIQEA